MNKRKLLLVAMALSMIAILAVGGTLAYFTDIDAETNIFTVGNVEIDLYETFNPELSKLFPTTGKVDGVQKNAVEKKVYVANTGSEDAYVRVHIAIPAVLDVPNNASANVLHFNMSKDSVADGKWSWGKTKDIANYPGNDGDWNMYTAAIGGVDYNVYVVTYETALKYNENTCEAIYQVYMDKSVTNEKITELKNILGDDWKILVAAEGAQKEGFADAYEALNEAFGVPGTYTVSNWEIPGDKTIDTVKGSAPEVTE